MLWYAVHCAKHTHTHTYTRSTPQNTSFDDAIINPISQPRKWERLNYPNAHHINRLMTYQMSDYVNSQLTRNYIKCLIYINSLNIPIICRFMCITGRLRIRRHSLILTTSHKWICFRLVLLPWHLLREDKVSNTFQLCVCKALYTPPPLLLPHHVLSNTNAIQTRNTTLPFPIAGKHHRCEGVPGRSTLLPLHNSCVKSRVTIYL